jgi:hypothetical protein
VSLELLGGLLAPYNAPGSSDVGGSNPLLMAAVQAAMSGMGGGSSAGVGSGGGSGAVPNRGPLSPSHGGNVQSWIDQAEQITGISGDERMDNMLRILIEHESGGNPTIVNDTPTPRGYHAAGLAQMIPPTFQAYNLPGLGGIFNPVANLSAAIKYMQDRYGSIANTPGIASVLAGNGYQPY